MPGVSKNQTIKQTYDDFICHAGTALAELVEETKMIQMVQCSGFLRLKQRRLIFHSKFSAQILNTSRALKR